VVRSRTLASLIERRQALHRSLQQVRQQNQSLTSQLETLQPLATVGSLMCMIAHEVNNLLTPMANFADLALRHPEDQELTQKALVKAVKSSQQACKIMESLVNMAHGKQGEKTAVKISQIIGEVFTCLARDLSKDGIEVRLDVPGDLEIYCVPVQIQQVLMNLILNARQAMMPGGGILTIVACRSDGGVCIEVCDTGPGIPAQILDRIFEPFFSTKDRARASQEGGGLGLGLAFCKLIVDSHKGRLTVNSRPKTGTVFQIFLPNPADPAPELPRPERA